MLTAGIRHGFAPDPALPSRDVLLDTEAVREHLASVVGPAAAPEIRACVPVRTKYRIGESLRVTYRLVVGDRAELVTARAFRHGASGSAYRAALAEGGAPAGALPGVLHDPALDAVWWTFPDDRRLRTVRALLHPPPDLARLVDAAGSWCASELVEYAPERSATFRATTVDGSSVGYAKAYAPATVDLPALAARYRRIAAALEVASDSVTAPAPLGWSAHRNVMLLQPMPGVRWSELEGTAVLRAVGRLGAGIATLHDTDLAGRGTHPAGEGAAIGLARFARLDVRRVVHSAQLVALARPDVAAHATRLIDRLAGGPPAGDEPVVLHGDCHPKNALLDGDRVALIDFDQAGAGAAAADIGSLLARLRQDVVLGEHGARDGDQRSAAFLAGYRALRPLPSEPSLRWHTAAALVAERAVRAVNRVHLAALDRLGCLLEAADDVLRTGVRP